MPFTGRWGVAAGEPGLFHADADLLPDLYSGGMHICTALLKEFAQRGAQFHLRNNSYAK